VKSWEVIGDRVRVPACLLLIVALIGCTDRSPVLVSIKGKAQLPGGEPAAEMALSFQPLDESNKHTAPSPTTDKLGNFSVRCARGRYRVALTAVLKGSPGGMPGGGAPPPPSVAPAPTFEPLIIEVPETGKEDFVLTFK
jgi:hypothetical protein